MVIVTSPHGEKIVFKDTSTVALEDGHLVVYATQRADYALAGFAPHGWENFRIQTDQSDE